MELDLMPAKRHPTSGCRPSPVECRALPPPLKKPAMPHLPLLLLSPLLLLAFTARAENTYTNHAGNPITGTVIALAPSTVTLSNSTETLTLPLSIFPESEQRRLAADFGTPCVPLAVQRAITAAERAMTRSRLRASKGLCTPEQSASFCTRTESSLRAYLDSQLSSGTITPAERTALGH